MKFLMDEGPLYMQPPKSSVKQGFVKSGKKILCDLIFSNENDRFLTWLEKLEEYAQQIIYDNRSKWFETELDRHDIESSITSPYKMYKSGKFYIIRTNVPIALGKCDLKIYDENELEVNHDDIKENTNVMTILEFKGIKCSSRSFQFEIELKQMLVMKPDLLFEKCILHRGGGTAIGASITPPSCAGGTRTVCTRSTRAENRDERSRGEGPRCISTFRAIAPNRQPDPKT